MRYTTIIDISEMREIYRNKTARLIYLHLALKAGYHDDDRDIAHCSIRGLAADVGVTTSAVRHALQQLEHAGLLRTEGGNRIVKKFVEEVQITRRARTKREMQEQILVLERQKKAAEQEQRSAEKAAYDPQKATDNDAFRRLQRFASGKTK